jgi:hypothetical protein
VADALDNDKLQERVEDALASFPEEKIFFSQTKARSTTNAWRLRRTEINDSFGVISFETIHYSAFCPEA